MKVTHAQYVTAFNNLPPVICSYILDGEVDPVIEDIGNKYSFHVDVVGELHEHTIYMLMGLVSPAELLGSLVLKGINADVAKSVLEELNSRVFMPLQKKMRETPQEDTDENSGAEETAPAEAAPAQSTAPRVAAEEKAISEAAPAQDQAPRQAAVPQVSVLSLKNGAAAQMPPREDELAPTTPPPTTPPAAPAPLPAVAAPQSQPVPAPHARTMASDMELVQHGYDALRVPGMPLPPSPSLASPARTFQTASVPVSYAAPAAQPPYSEPAPQAREAPPPPPRYDAPVTAPVRLTPVDRVHEGLPLTKEYGSDPYREPITN